MHTTLDFNFLFDGLFSKIKEISSICRLIYLRIESTKVKFILLEWCKSYEEVKLFIYD